MNQEDEKMCKTCAAHNPGKKSGSKKGMKGTKKSK